MKLVPIIFTFILANFAFGQVKIGSNINTIDGSSLVELESNSKVFVLSRVSTVEMNAIAPLNGALVYNTDDDCIFQFNNGSWSSLCVNISAGETVTTLIDNANGTFTYTSEDGTSSTIEKATITDNGDGTYSFSNDGTIFMLLDSNANSNPYDNSISTLSAVNVQEAIDELNSAIGNSDATDLDRDDTNELNTAIALNGTSIEVTDAGSTLSQDLDGTDAGSTLFSDGTFATDAELAASDTADLDKDDTNELNTAIALNGTSIEVTDAGSTLSQDLDGTFATDAELAASDTADLDKDDTNELNTAIALNGTSIEVTDAGSTLSQDLDGTFATDAELAASDGKSTVEVLRKCASRIGHFD